MERFIWSLDGIKLNDSRPLHFRPNERLRVTFVNDTMMAHPMHLHGMWSDVEGPDGAFQVRKHTVVVQPAQRVSFRVTADAWVDGPFTAICSITWRPACSGRWWSHDPDFPLARHRSWRCPLPGAGDHGSRPRAGCLAPSPATTPAQTATPAPQTPPRKALRTMRAWTCRAWI
jgi:hypothetical protein